MAHSYSTNKGYSSIQEFRDFVDDISEVIDEYLEDTDNDINNIAEDDCIYISDNLEISVVNRKNLHSKDNTYLITELVRIEEGLLQADLEEIEDKVACNYLFVR